MNKVILLGRLTKDPEVRYTQAAEPLAIARFTIAADRPGVKEGQTADFPNCVAFGKTAEFAEKYLRKGSKIALEGRITTGSYDDKDGRKVYTTEVTVERLEFAESKAAAQPQDAPGTPQGDFMAIPEGIEADLPFK